MTLYQRRCDVMTSYRRLYDVIESGCCCSNIKGQYGVKLGEHEIVHIEFLVSPAGGMSGSLSFLEVEYIEDIYFF